MPQASATIIDSSIPAGTAGWLTWADVPGSFVATGDPEKLLYISPTDRRFTFEGAGTAHLAVAEEVSGVGFTYFPGCGPYESGCRESVVSLFEAARFAVATMETYDSLEARLGVGDTCEVRMTYLDGSSSGGFELALFLDVLRDGEIQGADEDDMEAIWYDYADRRLCMTIDGGAPAFDPPAKVELLKEIIRDTATTPVTSGQELAYLEDALESLLAALLHHPDTPVWVHEAVAQRLNTRASA